MRCRDRGTWGKPKFLAPGILPVSLPRRNSPLPWSKGHQGYPEDGSFQALILARNLPSTGARITGLAVVGAGSGSGNPVRVTFKSLRIVMGHWILSTLSPDFAKNYTNSSVVLDVKSQAVSYRWDSWTTFKFSRPFVYDGSSHLVIEFQKVIDSNAQIGFSSSHMMPTPSIRAILPQAQLIDGVLGSGASTASRAQRQTPPLTIRLLVDEPTVNLTCPPNNNTSNRTDFFLGAQFDATVHGPTGAGFASFASLGFGPGVPLLGGMVHLDLPAMLPVAAGTVDSNGEGIASIRIPMMQSLVGSPFVLQAAVAPGPSAFPRPTCAASFIVSQ